MTEYEPVSRRPIAAIFRTTAHGATDWCVRKGVHPDTVSYFSMIAAAGAALCFWQASRCPALLIAAPLFCYLRLWCNMLDGMVAVASGKASARGEILNDLPDRLSDVIIFAGVAQSGFANLIVAYWAAILAVLTAYVGLFGQAVGTRREFGGLMSKPWRMVALHIGAWSTFIYFTRNQDDPGPFLTWSCVAVIIGCVQTMAVRLRRIMAALHNQPR